MPLIRIQERSERLEDFQAIISFDHEAEYGITISDPFSEEEEQQLEWYFEQHLRFPFTDQVKAQRAAASISTYGESLFKQIFADSEVYALYKECLRSGLNSVQIEIAGSPSFHRLHWEALKDPHFQQPLAFQASMIRKNLHPQVVRAVVRPSPTINLLIVTARPFGKHDVGYRTISRPLVELLRQTNLPVKIDVLRPGTYQTLEIHLREVSTQFGVGYYHMVHFDTHGAVFSYDDLCQTYQAERYLYQNRYGRMDIQKYDGDKAFLFLEDVRENYVDPVEAAELADVLINHQIPIAILNACQSGKQVGASETSLGSRLMQAGVQVVLAMGYSVTVSAAELLMRTLYEQLFAKHDLSTAIRYARQELFNDKGRRAYFNQKIDLEDWLLPVVYENREQTLIVREFTQEERTIYYERLAARYLPRSPRYGFVGRDLDVLQIEKCLLAKRNIILVHGMGGAGKTTLLHHLCTWWQITGLVDKVFYFGYDEKAWTHQQILDNIAKQLLSAFQYNRDFQPLSLDAQQALLTQQLRSQRHLLIIDNLESITGVQLAIQHILSLDEQAALHRFLSDLADGRTLVLLGTRGSETWLKAGTFEDNVYNLDGLDPEAASMLAERILERNHATQYRQDANLQRLLKLLNGFPLALEVVLANLAHQKPDEIITALQVGDVKLDTDDGQKKTESILRCIDYSHSNLSLDAQSLLFCLAPFTSVINLKVFDQYITHLKQQPALVTLSFDKWHEIIREAENWGLLNRDPDAPDFLYLQPIFPYFLRSRLAAAEQASMRHAVETAFREHYEQFGEALYHLLMSKDPQGRQKGRRLIQLEFENLLTALDLALDAHVWIIDIYSTLAQYITTTQDHERGLTLSQMVLDLLEAYPTEKRTGLWGIELSIVITDVANRKLQLQEYPVAEALYHRALSILLENTSYDKDELKTMIANNYYQLGMAAELQHQGIRAEEYYQQALQIRIESNDRHGEADAYYQLGALAQRQHQWMLAEERYQKALQIFIDLDDRYAEADAYYQLSAVLGDLHHWDKAQKYCYKALQIYIDFNDQYVQAKVYHQLGQIAEAKREWTQAEEYYQQSLHIKIAFNDRYELAITYHQLGIVAQQKGEWVQSEQYYQKALNISRDFNDHDGLANTYHQLARLAQEQHQWEQADRYYEQALNIYKDLNDRYKQAKTYLNMGGVAQMQNLWLVAEQYYQSAIPIFNDLNDLHGQAVTYTNLGAVSQEQYQWDQAEKYYQLALPIFNDLNDLYGQANIYSNLGHIALNQRQLAQSRNYFLRALEIFVSYQDSRAASSAMYGLTSLWKENGDSDLLSHIASIFEISPDEAKDILNFIAENKS